MGAILITSSIGEDYRDDLEQLLFFNPGQCMAEAGIRRSIEHYGVPEITIENNYLRIRLNSQMTAQSLYLIDRTDSEDILAGVLVYIRDCVESLSVLHIAVSSQYLLKGPVTSARLVWRLLHQVIDCAACIKGVRNIELIYGFPSHRSNVTAANIAVSRSADNTKIALPRKTAATPEVPATRFVHQHDHEFANKTQKKNVPRANNSRFKKALQTHIVPGFIQR